MSSKAIAVVAAFAAVAVALVVALPAGAAGNAGSTQVTTFDPTGAVFTCPTADYTVLGGTVRSASTTASAQTAASTSVGRSRRSA